MRQKRNLTRRVALLLLPAVLPAMLLVLLAGPARGEEEYVIGPDDLLHIMVWDYKELDQVLPVRPDGKISFPLAGEVQASGLTASQLTNHLAELLSKSVKNPNVSVVIKEIRRFRVFFLGQVSKPGVYPIKPETPLLQALTLAGGLTQAADLPAAYIVRGNARIPVDLRRLIQEADLSQNLRLRTDDTIVVPEIAASPNPQEVLERRIYVLGKVQKPGIYAIRQEVPILHAIFLAGGYVEPAADLSGAFVIRGKERIPVDLRRLIKGDPSQNVMVRHEDTIVLPDGGDMQNSVFIMGEVNKPGPYPRGEALTLMKLVSLAGGFTKFAAPGRITILREPGDPRANAQPTGGEKVRLKVNFNAIQSDPQANPDVLLAPGDVVIVSQTLF